MAGSNEYTVVCEWEENDGWIDADEIVVAAKSAKEAITKAKAAWRLDSAKKWPRARVTKAWVLIHRKIEVCTT